MREILLSSALVERWDVIIAGSSFAAMFFLKGLPKGLRVLVLEKGQVQDHADQLVRDTQGLEDIGVENSSDYRKTWTAHSVFGGNSNCWWACVPRLHPHDFQLKSRYGVGEDWPIGYDQLEPFYGEVEAIMEVAGGGSDHVLPRSAPFPFEPHAPSRSDVALQAASNMWWAQPAARSNGGRRNICCANGICNLCPVDSKFTVLNSVDLFARDGVFLALGAEVRAVETAAGVEEAGADRGRAHRGARRG